MGNNCKVGDTLKLPGVENGYNHLWVVVTPKYGDPQQVIIVNITSQKLYSDTTVMLDVGDHPFIKHPTVVYYTDARIVLAQEVEKYRAENSSDDTQPFESKVIKRIQDGVEISPFVKPRIKAFYLKAIGKNTS